MPSFTSILPILHTMVSVICSGGAFLLFLRGRKKRSRLILAGTMTLWGLLYAVCTLSILLGSRDWSFIRTDVANPLQLTVGGLLLIVLSFYPLEIVRPGWLSLKKAGILLLPYAGITSLYYILLFLLGQKPETLQDMDQFIGHISEFNVWYRLVMTLSIIVYLVCLFRFTWHYKECYRLWYRNNCSYDIGRDILWLRQYGIGVLLVGAIYFLLLFYGNMCWFIVHNVSVQCFFCYTLYKGLFHNSPYAENTVINTTDRTEVCRQNEEQAEEQTGEQPDEQPYVGGALVQENENESTFLNKLPFYRDEIARWMSKEKPYLNPGFKLMDVSDILPLNRTYLSRVFNDGFGDSFSNVVRDYRIREAEWMLANRKDIPVGQVGELCGFSSPSTFHRAFVQSHDGLTPNRYRKQVE